MGLRLLVCVGLLSCMLASDAQAQFSYWACPPATPGDWADPANWTGRVPLATDAVYIRNGGTAIISVEPAVAASLQLGGSASSGTIEQTGSSLTVGSSINLGHSYGKAGTYRLVAGDVGAASLNVISGSVFQQSGGTGAFSGTIAIDNGTYQLSNTAVLSALTLNLGQSQSGTFTQTGGQAQFGAATIYSGVYRFSGGTLSVNAGLTCKADLDFASGAGVLTLGAGSYNDLSVGRLLNTGAASLTAGANSLVVFRAGFDPATAFGSYQTEGVTYVLGQPLVVPAGRGFVGKSGAQINDHVLCSGTISTPANKSFSLRGGAEIEAGASVDLAAGSLYVNDMVSALRGGSLSAAKLYIGGTAPGRFIQNGGNATYSSTILVSSSAPGAGSLYELQDGQAQALDVYVGNAAAGTFRQSGGSLTVLRHLIVGSWGSGTLELSGGSLSASVEYVGYSSTPGLVGQSGGTNHAAYLHIRPTGRYELGGGELHLAEGMLLEGQMDFTQPGSTLAFDGLLDLTGATGQWQHLNNAALAGGPRSLLQVLPGFDPQRDLASYQSSGITHVMGSTLVVPAGRTIFGQGIIHDPVECSGVIRAATGHAVGNAIDLRVGLRLLPGGSVSLGEGELRIDEQVSQVAGASAQAGRVAIGVTADGRLQLDHASLRAKNELVVGDAASGRLIANRSALYGGLLIGSQTGSTGRVDLTDSTLSGNVSVGDYGSGEFYQTGGKVTAAYGITIGSRNTGSYGQSANSEVSADKLWLGYYSGSLGSYTLEGGRLAVANEEYVGYSGNGSFVQTGGTNSASQLLLGGQSSTGPGTYALSGSGALEVTDRIIEFRKSNANQP